MPVTVKDPELESKLERLGQASGIRVSKRALTLSILDAAVSAADRRGVSIGRIIEELKPVRARRAAKTRRRTAPPPTLKLTKSPAT